jgi:ribosome-interacting GTPase 1
VVLLGPPNSGKSALLAALTNAKPEVAAYPFTTRSPQPGLLVHEGVRVQLIDLPPVTAEFLDPWLPGLVRGADAALAFLDLGSDDGPESVDVVVGRLAQCQVELVGEAPPGVEDETIQHVKSAIVATKLDLPGAAERLRFAQEWFAGRFAVMPLSTATREGLDRVAALAYDLLGVIRIYTKVVGKPVDRDSPFTLPVGGTVGDLARAIHGDLERTLKYARVWGTGVFEGQTVKRDHALHDADVVELHV